MLELRPNETVELQIAQLRLKMVDAERMPFLHKHYIDLATAVIITGLLRAKRRAILAGPLSDKVRDLNAC